MRRVTAVAAVVVFLLVGCSPDTDTATPQTTPQTTDRSMPEGEERILPVGDEPTVLGPLGDTDAQFETEDGLVQVGDADVPDAIARSFPIPDGLDVQLSSSAGPQSGLSGVIDMSFDELVKFYETTLAPAGFDHERSQFVEGVVAVFDFEGPDGSGQLAIASAPGGGHSVLVTFES